MTAHFLIRAVAFTTERNSSYVTHREVSLQRDMAAVRMWKRACLVETQWQLCVTQRVSLVSEVQRRSETPALFFTRCWGICAAFILKSFFFSNLFLFNSLFFLFYVSVSFSFPCPNLLSSFLVFVAVTNTS